MDGTTFSECKYSNAPQSGSKTKQAVVSIVTVFCPIAFANFGTFPCRAFCFKLADLTNRRSRLDGSTSAVAFVALVNIEALKFGASENRLTITSFLL